MPRNSPFGNLTSRFEKTQNRVLRRMDATGRIIRAAKHGVLAQLVRAPACHVGGREFKSRTSRHQNSKAPGDFARSLFAVIDAWEHLRTSHPAGGMLVPWN